MLRPSLIAHRTNRSTIDDRHETRVPDSHTRSLQPLTELIEARIWAGLHYRSADVAGQLLGRNIANYGAANYFQTVGR